MNCIGFYCFFLYIALVFFASPVNQYISYHRWPALMGICLFWQPAIMLCLVVFCYLIDCVCYVYVLCKIKFLLSSSVLLLDHPVLGLPMIYLLIYYIQTTLNPCKPCPNCGRHLGSTYLSWGSWCSSPKI